MALFLEALIKHGEEAVVARRSRASGVELCSRCSVPVLEFLETHHLLREQHDGRPEELATIIA